MCRIYEPEICAGFTSRKYVPDLRAGSVSDGQIIHWKKNCILNDVVLYVPDLRAENIHDGQIIHQ